MNRTLSPGKALYWGYYFPKMLIRKWWKRGLCNQFGDYAAERAMIAAIDTLEPLERELEDGKTAAAVHFLTGKKYWHQTCWCAYSLLLHSPERLRIVLYDDGSLSAAQTSVFFRLFEEVEVVSATQIEERLDKVLSFEEFPVLRTRRKEYPHLRKLTDIHVGTTGWKLVLDSDMLFFRRPDELLHWMAHAAVPCCMRDVKTSYGYTPGLMQELAGVPVPERVNVGVCGLRSDDIDWSKVEYWCKTMLAREGSHYTQEQALVALLLCDQKVEVLAEEDYIVLPNEAEVRTPGAILHHYVAESKVWYFRQGWKGVYAEAHKNIR